VVVVVPGPVVRAFRAPVVVAEVVGVVVVFLACWVVVVGLIALLAGAVALAALVVLALPFPIALASVVLFP